MFRSSHFRFLVGIGLALVLLAVLFIIILTHGKPAPTPKPMASYADNPTARVAMLIDGPVNAPSLHNQVLVIISNSVTTFTIFKGYDDHVLNSTTFPMDESAFHVFLRSLEFAGYNDGSDNPNLSQASGYCPTANRYIFTFNVNGKQRERYWTTDCSGPHTYDGNLSLTLTLFESQVPNYNSLTTNLNI